MAQKHVLNGDYSAVGQRRGPIFCVLVGITLLYNFAFMGFAPRATLNFVSSQNFQSQTHILRFCFFWPKIVSFDVFTHFTHRVTASDLQTTAMYFEVKNLDRRSSYGRYLYVSRKLIRSSTPLVSMIYLSDPFKLLKWLGQVRFQSGQVKKNVLSKVLSFFDHAGQLKMAVHTDIQDLYVPVSF